ncbi:MAG: hypothetical protein Q8R92_14755 [Deltaproteobacteria bacterium]|nr:hypothetical protein [Deltaproteobacteria bacterium]
MSQPNFMGAILLWATAAILALSIYYWLRGIVHDVIDQAVGLDAASTFFTRVLFLVLLFTALSAALEVQFDLKPDSPFLEYVWKFTYGFSETLENLSVYLFGFLVLATLLVGALRHRRDG